MRRTALLLTALAMAVAGCAGAPIAGTPFAAEAGPAPGPGLPPRPRELPLDGVDPCALLTGEQRAELGFDGPIRPGYSDTPLFTGPTCTTVGFEPRGVGLTFTLATDDGLDELVAPGSIRDGLAAREIVGFPAVLARPKHVDFCSVDVDLAEGQFLDVMFSVAAKNPPIPQDQLRSDAVEIAEAAVTTLLAG